MHRAERPLILPNAWDHASAAAFAAAGFPAIGTTSLGVAAAAGKPDGAGATREETVALARTLTRLSCPISIDLEDGFSADPEEVADLAEELSAFGVAGINLEDAMGPSQRLCDAIAAVKERVPALFLNARTDAYWLKADNPLAVARTRVMMYADAGADGVFVPGIIDPDHITTIVGAVPVPLNVLFLPGRHKTADLADLGVRRISMGSLPYRAALRATIETALAVRDGGAFPEDLPTYADVLALAVGRTVRRRELR